MTIGKQLFDLIHQLNKGEKRAFKIYLKKYTGEKHLQVIYIFDVLLKMKIYDKKLFNDLLLKKINKNKISYEQFQLKRSLLNALTDLQQNKKKLFIGDIINKIELSLKYKMPEMAQEWLKKGHKYAKGKEATALRAILLRYELKYNKLIEEESETIRNQQEACIKELKEETDYAILKNKFYNAYRKNIHLKNELSEQRIEKLAQNSLFLDDDLADTFQKKNYLFFSKMLYAEYKGDFDAELIYAKKLVENYENSPHIIPQRLRIYLIFNQSLVLAYNKKGLYEEGHRQVEYLKNLIELYNIQNTSMISYIESNSLYCRMILLNEERKYQEIYAEKKTIELFLKNQDSAAPFFNLSFFVYVLAKSSFYVQAYEECINWIHEFLQIAPKDKFQKGFIELKFLEFAVQYELGNLFLLDSILNAIYYLVTKYQLQGERYLCFYQALRLFKEGRFEEINQDELKNAFTLNQTYLWLQTNLRCKNKGFDS